MTGQEAARVLHQYLWEYEKAEILDYEQVYFFNVQERVKQNSAFQLQSIYS